MPFPDTYYSRVEAVRLDFNNTYAKSLERFYARRAR
jgi:hypothetical protein